VQLTAESYVVLHEVRLRGLVERDDDEVVVALLDAGLVARARSALRITVEGRDVHASWARLVPGSDAEAVATRAYEQFLTLNRELIRVCHDWQVRPGDVPNDHRDVRYDWEVIDRLRGVDERTRPVVRRLARDVERFDPYPARLRQALVQVEEGDHAWFASPRIDSYHTVWMHLHEDLLLALGVDRGAEPELD
jgi:hypothetical protein